MDALIAFAPFALLLLLCSLMMLFMHRGGGHDHRIDEREELARRVRASKEDART
ncbi:MAG: DUF2933 domain-containing protein [Chloroflexi bacterium]|nr:DUF2933 domain-containing protein [Chloroflexota bacterium]